MYGLLSKDHRPPQDHSLFDVIMNISCLKPRELKTMNEHKISIRDTKSPKDTKTNKNKKKLYASFS